MENYFYDLFEAGCGSTDKKYVHSVFKVLMVPIFIRFLATHFSLCKSNSLQIKLREGGGVEKNEVWPHLRTDSGLGALSVVETIFVKIALSIDSYLQSYLSNNANAEWHFFKDLWATSTDLLFGINNNMIAFEQTKGDPTSNEDLQVFRVDVDVSEQCAEKLETTAKNKAGLMYSIK